MTISNEAIEGAKKAMYEVTPPPGMTTAEWIERYGEYAWLAGAIAAAAPIIRAECLTEAAERFKVRSDTLHNTMKEMTASREYGLEDIVRYGAYSSEANTTATWLRARAAAERGEG